METLIKSWNHHHHIKYWYLYTLGTRNACTIAWPSYGYSLRFDACWLRRPEITRWRSCGELAVRWWNVHVLIRSMQRTAVKYLLLNIWCSDNVCEDDSDTLYFFFCCFTSANRCSSSSTDRRVTLLCNYEASAYTKISYGISRVIVTNLLLQADKHWRFSSYFIRDN